MSRRRRLIFALLGCGLLLLALPLLMALQTTMPPLLDPEMEVQLPDGTKAPLRVVVERAAGFYVEPSPSPSNAEPGGGSSVLDVLQMSGEEKDPSDLYCLAEWASRNGRPEEAVALLRSIPEDDPQYARAMRLLGWDYYAKQFDDPTQGIYFVNLSLAAEPFEGNAWQDAYRIYWRSVFD